MTRANRILDPEPVADLAAYRALGGGRALELVDEVGAEAIIATVRDAGIRGRGGAGFPTGIKWATVAEFSHEERPTIVINAAEGEPGTFKDRAILRTNPYRTLEGALVAAKVMGSDEVVIAMKDGFEIERERLERAVAEFAPLVPGITIDIATGPASYLFGEETAMLEVLEGRPPFPRVTPPYRRGIEPGGETHSSSDVELTGDEETGGEAALVDNVETFANVPLAVVNGPEWFRSVGTEESPGTIVCTVSGATERDGVGEFELGTPLAEVIRELGGHVREGANLLAVLNGVSNAPIRLEHLAVRLTYEDFAAIGSGLGSASFIVLSDQDSAVDAAAEVARFLAVESCGQCTACKGDAVAIAERLGAWHELARYDDENRKAIAAALSTVTDGARCALATQTQTVVGALLEMAPATPVRVRRSLHIGPALDLVDEVLMVDQNERRKRPDWSMASSTTEIVEDGLEAWPAQLASDGTWRFSEEHGHEWVTRRTTSRAR